MDPKLEEALESLRDATGSEYRPLSPGETFCFSCHEGLSCFSTCCGDINIFLTPYDVLRMRRAIGITSGDFLARYTTYHLGDRGMPVLKLRMRYDAKKSCPFVSLAGCKIYHDRPWSCRIYPLALAASSTGEEFYFIIDSDPSCLGFRNGRQWTLQDWKIAQGILSYDKMNRSFREITLHPYFQDGRRLTPQQAKTFYRTCYNLDEFRRFLFETKFFDIYDVGHELIEGIKESDERLLEFGFQWLRFNLFWEDTLRLKDEALQALLQSKRDMLGIT